MSAILFCVYFRFEVLILRIGLGKPPCFAFQQDLGLNLEFLNWGEWRGGKIPQTWEGALCMITLVEINSLFQDLFLMTSQQIAIKLYIYTEKIWAKHCKNTDPFLCTSEGRLCKKWLCSPVRGSDLSELSSGRFQVLEEELT